MSLRSSGSANARIYIDAANGDLIGSDYVYLGQDSGSLDFVINTGGNAGNIHLQPKAGTNNGILYVSGSTRFGLVSSQTHQFTGSINVNGSITSSLFGTSSWASNAITSSYILNAISSSYALSASYAKNATTANKADNVYIKAGPSPSNLYVPLGATNTTLDDYNQLYSDSRIIWSNRNIINNSNNIR